MSGSIGASRIKHSAVQDTIDFYINRVLKGFNGFVSAKATGSTVDPKRPDHGDVDLAVHVEGEDLKQVKKDFKAYLESLPDNITMPFPDGRNKGKKAQLYGAIVTCMCPIQGFEGLGVQIDNNIVLSAEEQEYQKSFLDLAAPKQALLMGLARVILQEENPETVFKRMGIKKLPPLESNQEFEFVLSPVGLTLRKVTLDGFKETARENIWLSRNWDDARKLFTNFNIDQDFDGLLAELATKLTNPRSRRRVVGVMGSMINIGPGEVGTPKGDGKQRAIDAAREKLDTINEVSEEGGVQTVALYGGGFKPPHKAHFADAEKLSKGVDRLIIFIGPKVREGVPITAEQSQKIWNIYKSYLPVPTEVRISERTPISDIYKLLENSELGETKFIVGKGQGVEEDKKFAYLLKNQAKYPNVTLKTLPTISDHMDEKFSASSLRKSIEVIKKGDWMPSCLDRDDARKVLDILITPLQQEALQEEIGFKVGKVLNEVRCIEEYSRPVDTSEKIIQEFLNTFASGEEIQHLDSGAYVTRFFKITTKREFGPKLTHNIYITKFIPTEDVTLSCCKKWHALYKKADRAATKVTSHTEYLEKYDKPLETEENKLVQNSVDFLHKSTKSILKFFQKNGYYNSNTGSGEESTYFRFIFGSTLDVRKEVRKHGQFLYHFAPSQLDRAISAEGLKVSEGKSMNYGEPRIYCWPCSLLDSEQKKALSVVQSTLKNLNQKSGDIFSDTRSTYNNLVTRYTIDLDKLPEMKVYQDLEYEDLTDKGESAVYVTQNIPRSAIVDAKHFTLNRVKNTGQGKLVPLDEQCIEMKNEKQRLREASSGTPISPAAAISSENREKLSNLYKDINSQLGRDFNVKFNISSITITPRYDGSTVSGQYDPEKPFGSLNEVDDQVMKFDWASNMAGLIKYMEKNGVNLHPLPDIVLNKDEQEPGLLAKTADYNPTDKVITIYIKGRAPKDCCRSAAHELVHHSQNLQKQIGNVGTDKVSDGDKHLRALEEEAYRKGNMLFRGYTESLRK